MVSLLYVECVEFNSIKFCFHYKYKLTKGDDMSNTNWHATTILCVKKDNEIVLAGDGQVSLGNTIVKATANKLRRLRNGIIAGFAGATSDAFTLFERLEAKLEMYVNMTRAAVELSKDWRMDKYLRRLEAMMIIADKQNILLLSGSGDLLEPEDDVIAIGSGGNYAMAAAKALMDVPGISAEEVARKAMKIAGDICVFSNHNIRIEKISLIENVE